MTALGRKRTFVNVWKRPIAAVRAWSLEYPSLDSKAETFLAYGAGPTDYTRGPLRVAPDPCGKSDPF